MFVVPLYDVLLLLLDSFTITPLPTLEPVLALFTFIVIVTSLGVRLIVKPPVLLLVVFDVTYLVAVTIYLFVSPDTYTVA